MSADEPHRDGKGETEEVQHAHAKCLEKVRDVGQEALEERSALRAVCAPVGQRQRAGCAPVHEQQQQHGAAGEVCDCEHTSTNESAQVL